MMLIVTFRKIQRGPSNKLLFTIVNCFENFDDNEDHEDVVLSEIMIDDMAEVRLQFEQHLPPKFNPYNETSVPVPIFVLLTAKKHPSVKDCTVQLNVTCKVLNYTEQLTCTDKWLRNIDIGVTKCEFIGGYIMSNDLEIDFSVKKVETVTFARLYDDSALIDFHLSTAEGSVPVHKVRLAAHSDVFKAMFGGPWKETKDGRVEISGVTLNNLQHLKDYVYLGTLPDVGLRPLLLLSSYYFMETLKSDCIEKLVKSVNSENLYSLLEFACENNIPELTFAILLQTPDDIVDESYQINKEELIRKRLTGE